MKERNRISVYFFPSAHNNYDIIKGFCMKKFYFLAVFLFSCSKVELVDYEYDDYGYLPLHVGNQWTYINPVRSDDTLTTEITGLERINNKVYYKFNNFHFLDRYGIWYTNGCYIRKYNNNYYIHDGESEQIRYMFNVELKRQWEYNNMACMIMYYAGINIGENHYSGCVVINSRVEICYYNDWFFEDLGIVAIFHYLGDYARGFKEYHLHEAVINGERYSENEIEKIKKHSMILRKSVFFP